MVRINIDEILQSLPVFEPEHKTRSGCSSCGSGDSDSRCGNGLEKIYPTTAVRYGYMKHIGEFSYPPNMKFTCGARVVIQTSRGLEIGEQVSLVCSGCSKSVTREQVREYVRNSGEDAFIFDAGRVLREANRADLAEYARLQSMIPGYRELCRNLAKKYALPIKVVECELLFGGERAIFYFSAEGRIDFRNLVRDLLAELQTRIQMVQIGARDEARLLADFETCGRECCCKAFLKTLKPVTMKMAKLQKQTVDPSKVSGRCGRLKCCLRYEHESYEELAGKLPRTGARIRTAHGDGVVVNRQILTQLVQIQTFEDKLITVAIEDVLPGEPERLPRPAMETAEPKRPDAPRRTGAPSSAPGSPPPTTWVSPMPAERPSPDTAPPGSPPSSTEGRRPTSRGRMRRRVVKRETPPPHPRGDSPPAPTPGAENPASGMDPPKTPGAARRPRFHRIRRRRGPGPPQPGGSDSRSQGRRPPEPPAGA